MSRWLTCVLVLSTAWALPGVAPEDLPLAPPSPPPLHDKAIHGTSEAAVRAVVAGYERMQAAGLLPVVVGEAASLAGETQFSSVNIFGVEVPIIVLAKLALVIILIATNRGQPIVESLNALVEGELFPIGPREEEMANILHMTAGTAVAAFQGDVHGEINFAQARLPDGNASATMVAADLYGLPPGQYLLQLHQKGIVRDSCSRVGPLYNPPQSVHQGILGSMVVGASGRGSAVLSSTASLEGPFSVLGRSVAVIAVSDQHPPQVQACAAIARL